MTPQEWVSFVLDVLKLVVWPTALVIGAWLVLPRLLGSRKFEFSGYGVKVAAAEQQQSIAQPAERLALPATNPLPPVNREAIRLLEEGFRRELEAIPQANKEAVLVRALSVAHLLGHHAAIYNIIFGSQIAGLRRLDEVGSVTVNEARQFFQPYERAYPEIYKDYKFDGWLGYMVSNGLVIREGDRLKASPFGHDFLVWLRESRLTEAKAG